MADNITIKDGAGVDRTVAADDVGGVHTERVKLGWGADGVYNDVSATNPMPITGPTMVELASTTAVWANSSAASTEKLTTLTLASSPNPGRLLAVFLRNPSAVTSLVGRIQHTWTDPSGGTTRYADLSNPAGVSTFTVNPANADGQVFVVDGGMFATTARLSLKNAAALGGADGFTASVRVFALCTI